VIITNKNIIREADFMQGYIYVLSNPSMPNIYKIGQTTDSVQNRILELSRNSNMPTQFEEVFSFFVFDTSASEIKIHNELKEYRINPDREFFKADITIIENALGCLFPQYNDFGYKIRNNISKAGKLYYKNYNNIRAFLEPDYKVLKRENFNLEYFINIYKKGNDYYHALCYSKICSEEDYLKWIAEKEQPSVKKIEISMMESKTIKKTITISE
jgi:hypothetical protein